MGWAQFEQVCEELLAHEGVTGLEWHGRADGLRIAVAGHVPESLAGRPLTGPVLLAIAWIKDRTMIKSSSRAIASRLAEAPERPECRSVLIFANADGLSPRRLERVIVLGGAEIGALLEDRPGVRRRVPSLLGVCDLEGLLDAGTAARSLWDASAARELVQVFVPTRTYRAALSVLERHYFAVLSGPPEMGKTAIARTLGLALHTEGWEVHECIRPEQFWDAFVPDRPQLFVADDAFGSTEYRPDAAERWAVDLDCILRALDDRHWLVWTSRPAPLKAGLGRIHREHGVERFPRPAEVHVDAANLDIEEKALILYRHARAAGLPQPAIDVVQLAGTTIVRHPHFTPERISRFVRTRLSKLVGLSVPLGLHRAIVAEIAEPTQAMVASFDALSPEHRALLLALVDAPPGPVSERDLAAAARRHSPNGLPRPPAELVDRLTDHFLRIVPPASVTWVHPSWRDLVIERLATDAATRRRFLKSCSLEGVLLALSRAGGRMGERNRPLLVDDGDWDALAERLHDVIPELADADLLRLLATLEDGLAGGEALDVAELDAVAAAALRRIAVCWERGQSFTSHVLLERWTAVSRLVAEPPAGPRMHELYAPPPGHRFAPVPEPDYQPQPGPNWSADSARVEESIVARILADLDAA